MSDKNKTAANIKLENQQWYENHKANVREKQAEKVADACDIGPIPPVLDAARKESCRDDFLKFCLTYFPEIFTKPISKNHPAISKIMERAAFNGGQYAFCVERGGAKTTFCELFVIWCIAYGHKKFVAYVAASKEAATDSFDSIKSEFENNDLLYDDFPEICHAIRELDGKPNKAGGMMLDGQNLAFTWRKDKVVFPTVPGSAASGTVFKAAGFDSRLRGMKHKTKQGRNQRPDCVIVDDIQKDRTARNPRNATYQIKTLNEAIKGLKQRGTKMTLLVPGTRLAPHCFMSQITDRKKYPAFQGRIFQAMPAMPANLDLWREYWRIWVDSAREAWECNRDDETAWQDGKERATAYYAANRAAMDEGAEVSWPDMFEEDEISGIQNIMNIFLENEDAFWTEYQNQPREGGGGLTKITEKILEMKVTPDIPRGVIPAGTERLTLGIDVGQDVLFWLVTAWRKGFNGHIVAYGTYPEQPVGLFAAANVPRSLADMYPKTDLKYRLEKAVNAIIDGVLLEEWKTESGETMTVDRALIDANWEASRDTVCTVINRRFRQHQKNGRFSAYPLLPSRGRGTRKTFYVKDNEIETRTLYSYLQLPRKKEELVGTVWVNTNKTKSHAAERITAPVGSPESVTIHATPPGGHLLLFDHFTCEEAEHSSRGDLEYDAWEKKPTRTENHLWDCYNLTVVAAAMEGASHAAVDKPPERKRFTVKRGGVRWNK